MELVAVQSDIVWEDPCANHQHVRELLSRTTINPGALIVLPEMFDTGFSMQIGRTAQTASRDSESFLRELAQSYGATVLGGVTGPVVSGRASNEAVAFDPHGQELVRYRKMQPFSLAGEGETHCAGDRHRLFTWSDFSIAPFICYDLRFPEIFRPAAREGAELIVVIASWPSKRSEHWVRLLQARAIENQAYALGVNRCGTDPQFSYDGRTVLIDPMGNILFEADASEQVLTSTLDANVVRNWRRDFPALRDMRSA